jgi:hypothetical protein
MNAIYGTSRRSLVETQKRDYLEGLGDLSIWCRQAYHGKGKRTGFSAPIYQPARYDTDTEEFQSVARSNEVGQRTQTLQESLKNHSKPSTK